MVSTTTASRIPTGRHGSDLDGPSGADALLAGSPGADALLAIDPRQLTPTLRRQHLHLLQVLAAQVEAAHLASLVAECGGTPRTRTVTVDAPTDSAAEREAHRFGGGQGVHIARQSNGTRDLTFTDEVVDQIAPILHRTPGSVLRDLHVARLMQGPLSRVGESLSAGRITGAHARAMCRQAARMQRATFGSDPAADAAFSDQCAAFQRRILPIAESSTPGRTEAQAEKLIALLDAAAERQRRERAKARMGVWAQPEGDGLMSITAILASVDAARVMAAVDARAEESRAAASARHVGTEVGNNGGGGLSSPTGRLTVGQHRAHALVSLMGLRTDSHHESAAPHPGERVHVSAEVQVVVDARSLLALDPDSADAPAWIRVGSHAPGAVDRDDLMALLSDPTIPITLRRFLTDPVTGFLVDRGARSYAPNADLVAWLAARDGGCRFPGCAARATLCDVDHAEDFADGGDTALANTGLLCRRHHNRKTHGGWRIEGSARDGSCVFVAPDGTRHHHRPPPLIEREE